MAPETLFYSNCKSLNCIFGEFSILLKCSLQFFFTKKKNDGALVGVAQWIECQTANQKVVGSIPSQGTCLGCGLGPQ